MSDASLITPAVASLMLIAMGISASAYDRWGKAVKVSAVIIGMQLAFQTYARFKGWPL